VRLQPFLQIKGFLRKQMDYMLAKCFREPFSSLPVNLKSIIKYISNLSPERVRQQAYMHPAQKTGISFSEKLNSHNGPQNTVDVVGKLSGSILLR